MTGSGHVRVMDPGPGSGFRLKKVGNPYGSLTAPFGGRRELPGLDSVSGNNSPKSPEMTLFWVLFRVFPRSDRGW